MTPEPKRVAAEGGRARRAVTAVGRRVPFVIGTARETVTAARRSRYRRIQRAHPLEPHSALFKSYSGRSYSCSPRAIYERMLAERRFDDFELVWVFREPIARALAERGFSVRGLPQGAATVANDIDVDAVFGSEALEALRRATIVVWGTREHDIAHARCAYWFANTVIPWHLAPRPGQSYVQAWHGTPLKRLGCDIDLSMANNALYSGRQTHKRYRREGERITHLVTPSAFATEHLCSAMGLSAEQCVSKVVEVGYPRNDALASLAQEKVAAVKRRLRIPSDKKVVLYAPTWRDDQYATSLGYTLELGVDFKALRAQLGDGYVVLFRAHYLIASQFDFEQLGGFVLDVSDVSDVNDLYAASDTLITDYSSVFFDYTNLGKPIVFYMYDLDFYASEMRGFYIDLPDLPGPVVTTQRELVEALAAADLPDDELKSRYHRFRERFNPMDDGHASDRVLARVIDWRTST